MGLVAIAGGTSPTLGRSIVTAVRDRGKHDVIILTREPDDGKSSSAPSSKWDVPLRYINYDSINSIVSALDGVNTLISVLKINDPAAMMKCHSNLLEAAVKSGVARFAPADFALGPLSHQQVDVLANRGEVWKMCEDVGIKNGVECAAFHNGMFLNYLAQGQTFPKTRDGEKKREEVTAGLEDNFMLDYIDIPKGKLIIPVDSSGQAVEQSATDIGDIGKFVAAAIDLPKGKWHGFMGMSSMTITMAEAADIINNKTKAKVEHETINSEQCDERIAECDKKLANGFDFQPFMQRMVLQMMKVVCENQVGGSRLETTLNDLCPDVKTVKLEEFLVNTWGSA